MDYKLAEPSIDITSGSNWLTMLKFWGVNIVVSIVVTLLIVVIFYTFIAGGAATGGATNNDSLKGML
jgi:hypothetical protein